MSDVSKLKINNVTYNIKDSLALRDAPSDGEEYVRKNGAWEISSGGESDSIVFGDDSVIIQPGEGVGFYGDAINFENGSAIITTSERTIKNLWDIVADSFTTTVSYSTDDYVIHEENLYQFITDHPAGEWNDEDVVVTTIEDGLNSDSGDSGNSGGEGGKAKVMYFYEQTVNTATNAEIFRITDSRINTDTVVLECTFADPSYITSDVIWTSYEGYIAFTGTCTTATTANVTMAYKTENSISDRLMTLLWENPNPTSNFANQTISLDLSQYEVILFIVKQDTNNNYGNERAIDQNLGFVGETITLHVINHIVPNGATSQNSWISTRNADIITTGITFGTGYGKRMSDSTIGTANNQYCIPLKIYGISKNITIKTLSEVEDIASQAVIASSSNISNTNCKLLKSGNVINLNFTCSISNVSDGTTNLVSNLPKPKYELIFLGLLQDGSNLTTNSRFRLTTDGILQIYWPHRTISPVCELTTYISYLTVD